MTVPRSQQLPSGQVLQNKTALRPNVPHKGILSPDAPNSARPNPLESGVTPVTHHPHVPGRESLALPLLQ